MRNLLDLRGIPLHARAREGSDAARRGDQDHADLVADRDRSLPDPARHRHLRQPGRRGLGTARRRHPRRAGRHDAAAPACGSTCAAWCRAWRRRSRASRSGLILALVLLYLILVAQFRSFIDPVLILLAVPTGLTGVLRRAVSHRHDAQRPVADGRADDGRHGRVEQHPDRRVHASAARRTACRSLDAVVNSCRIRLRPILMTSLATVIGLVPMALKLGTGSEAYAPLARAIIGGLMVSVVLTVFIVPAAYLIVYRRSARPGEAHS